MARAALLPAAFSYRGLSHLHRLGRERRADRGPGLPGPTIAVGNLSVGGTGKTPVASWLARYCLARGAKPAVLLRGYGRDEGTVHRRLAPGAVVVEDPDRVRGGALAAAGGARIFILDDGFQRRDVRRDLDLLLVSVESAGQAPWPLPAGPWREPFAAARRADLIIVTRKQASSARADQLAARLARVAPGRPVLRAVLELSGFAGLETGQPTARGGITGLEVLASSGIADPDALAAMLSAEGARVRRLDWADHRHYTDEDVERIATAGRTCDRVVVTEKDAAKLRGRWPRHVPEPLVATLAVRWEAGEAVLQSAIDQVISSTIGGPGHPERT